MLFSLNGEVVRENTILGDDTIRDVALKLTHGKGGVYLFGKEKREVNGITVWQKYKRALTSWEVIAELRNVGIRKKCDEDKTFEFEELCAFMPQCGWTYVPLGQSLPKGVRVKPPSHSYSLAEYQNVSCARRENDRLLDYEGLTEVHAVSVRMLPHVYLPHAAGIVPEDSRLRASRSLWVWNIRREVYLMPSKVLHIDLQNVFSKVHATNFVPNISYCKVVRTFGDSPLPELPVSGLTFFLKRVGSKQSYITFKSDGSVKCVGVDAEDTNPIVHYVNQVLTWGTALQCDSAIIGTRIPYTPLFSSAFYPLWTSDTKERTTLSTKLDHPVNLKLLSPLWHLAVSPKLDYTRCLPPASIELNEAEVVVRNIPIECCLYASRYLEGWLCSDGECDDECSLTEEDDPEINKILDPFDTYIQKFIKAGYEMGMRYRGGILCMDRNAVYGFIPCPPSDAGIISPSLLTEWVPSVSFDATMAFLTDAAEVASECFPKEVVLNARGDRVGIRTQSGAIVRCKACPHQTGGLRFTTEHEILFPKTGLVYGTYRELVRQHGLNADSADFTVRVSSRPDDVPRWRDRKLLVTESELESFPRQLQHDMARFQHVRAYILQKSQIVQGAVLDVLDAEEIKVL